MSKRPLEASIERVRAVAPLAFLELGPEILDKVLQAVVREAGSSPLLDLRLVNRLFAQAIKEVVVRELIKLLERAARAYDAWQGRHVIPVDYLNQLFIDFGYHNQIRPMSILAFYAPHFSIKGSEWFHGFSNLIGILSLGKMPASTSRETRVLAWLLAFGAIEHPADIMPFSRSTDIEDKMEYRAWHVALLDYWPPQLLERLDVRAIYEVYKEEQLPILGYFTGGGPPYWMDDVAPAIYHGSTYFFQQHKLSMSQMLDKRFPVIQDWCAWIVQLVQLVPAGPLHNLLAAVVEQLPRQASDPRPQSIFEIVGPVQLLDNENAVIEDVVQWLSLFKDYNTHESLSAAEMQTTVETLGTMLVTRFRDETTGIIECLRALDIAQALEVVRRVPPRLMEKSPKTLAAFFQGLEDQYRYFGDDPAVRPLTIWHLRYAAEPKTFVFNTQLKMGQPFWLAEAWNDIRMGDSQLNMTRFSIVMEAMPADRHVPYDKWIQCVGDEIEIVYHADQVDNVVFWLKYVVQRPMPMDRVLADLYRWFYNEDMDALWMWITSKRVDAIADLLVRANVDLQAAAQALERLPEPARKEMEASVMAAKARAAVPLPLQVFAKPVVQ